MALETNNRYAYMDFIRVAAVFLVIVNHTNSDVFQSAEPSEWTWWISIVWYYLSKIGVPLFVMVSGACLLAKVDTYQKNFRRIMRIGIVLVVFSYLYFIVYVLSNYGGFRDVINIVGFLKSIIQNPITDAFWYLYFYLGILLMLPLFQRMANNMKKRDIEYLMALSFGIGAIWVLLTHYVPKLVITDYFFVPLFSVYIGILFAGHYIHSFVRKISSILCIVVIVLSLTASSLLTYFEYNVLGGSGEYWFMDDRLSPSIFTILCAMAAMILIKNLASAVTEKQKKRLAIWGGYAFGIYLVQDFLIEQTRYTLFAPFSEMIHPMLAVMIWEMAIFGVALGIVFLLKKIPWIGRLI